MKKNTSRYKQEDRNPQSQVREDLSRHEDFASATAAKAAAEKNLAAGESIQIRLRQNGFVVAKRRSVR